MRVMLVRCGEVRLTIRVNEPMKRLSIEPDEDDLARASDAGLSLVWDRVGRWSEAFRKKFPGWKVNGIDSRPYGVTYGQFPRSGDSSSG